MSRCRGLGSGAFKRELLREHHIATLNRPWDEVGVKELRRLRWQEALVRALAEIPAVEKRDQCSCAPWKVAVAGHLAQSKHVMFSAPQGGINTQREVCFLVHDLEKIARYGAMNN